MSWVWIAIRLTDRASPMRAETFDDARRLQAEPVVRQRFGEHDLAICCAAVLAGRDHPFRLGTPVGGNDAHRLPDRPPSTRPGCIGQAPHGAAFVAAGGS